VFICSNLNSKTVKLFGFSFIVLRVLTLGLGLVALWSLYWLMRHRHVNFFDAFLAVAVLAFNPWFVNLSFTFMTDVPFLALFLLSCALFVRGYKKRSRGGVALACVAATASMFIRQIGALFFPAALVALFFARKVQGVRSLFKTTLIFTVIGAAIYAWFGFTGLLPQTAGVHILGAWKETLKHAAQWWFYIILYLGLFLLPLFAAIALRRPKMFIKSKMAWFWFVVAGGVVAVVWLFYGKFFPYVGNMVNHQGLGPGEEVLQGTESAMFPIWIWLGLTVLAAIGAAWFLRFFAMVKLRWLRRRDTMSVDTMFIWFAFSFQFLFVMFVSGFDRYLLPSLSLALALAATYYGEYFRQRRIILVLAVLAIGAYSIIGTQNYLRWNELRWQETEALVVQGVAPENIEAGYGWCGWKLREKSQGIENPHDRSKPWYVNSICPVNSGEYAISFSELEGYEVIKKSSYKSWYDTSPFLFVLKKMR